MKASDRISSRTAGPVAPAAKDANSCSSTAERFALSGPSLVLDPRIHAYRKDIADIALAGRLIAPHYARPIMRRIDSNTSLFSATTEGAESVAQLDAGEEFAVLDITGKWVWGYRRKDHLVGYLPSSALEQPPTP